jgi:hypothetical protein
MKKEYWLITVGQNKDNGMEVSTAAIDEHPASWIAEYGNNGRQVKHLVFAMPITKAQFEALESAGYV